MKYLDDIEDTELFDYLDKIWPYESAKCPICGASEFTRSARVFNLIEYQIKSWDDNPQLFPTLPLICDSCGYIVLFSFIHLQNFIRRKRQE